MAKKKVEREYPVYSNGNRQRLGEAKLPHPLATALNVPVKPLEVGTMNALDCQAFSEEIGRDVLSVFFNTEEEKIWVDLAPKR